MNCLLCTLCFAYMLSDRVSAFDPLPRWGQATVVINDALFVHGGKTDQSNSYSYSSAPTNADLLFLSLSSSFDVSSPPWQLVNSSSSQGPAVAWHTLSAFNTSGILLFGGQPGPNSPTVLVDRSDSASLLNVYNWLDPIWTPEVASWAGQPLRRMHHSTVTVPSGRVFIIGGEKADGSNNPYSDHYLFDRAGPSFTLLPADNGPPGICGHASIILPDGRLFVLGGYSQPQATLLPFSTIFMIDTTQSNLSWSILSTSNSSLPPPRRAFAAASLPDGKILIHGGSDAVLQNNLDDGWILDTSQSPMVWTQVSALSQLGARREHFAISYGTQVIFGFGYGTNTAASAALQIFDLAKVSFTSTFSPTPPSSTHTQTLPGPSQTSGHGTGTQGTGTHGGNPTTTTDPHPGGGNGGVNHSNQTTAIAVGVVFGFLGLVVAAVAVYYVRQRAQRTRSERSFMALNGGDDGDDRAHSKEGIPAVRFSDDPASYNQHRWGFGVLDTIGLAGVLSAATGGRSVRHIPERRDMLEDEDREFGEWYDARGRDGSSGSVWSLKSVLGARIRSRQPSVTSTLGEGMVWREKSDPFSDEAALMRDEEAGYVPLGVAVAGAGRSQGRRQMSYSSTRDYVQAEQLDDHVEDEAPPPQSVPSKQNTLIIATQDHPTNSASSLSASPLQSASSNQTSSTSLEQPRSPGPSPSSIIGSTPTPTSQSIRRSDSWWARFSHTGFLDRRVSDASRRPSGMLDIRDPNPRPQLIAIEESTHSTLPDRQQHSRSPSESGNCGQFSSKNLSGMYGAHSKSLTSLGTADTEIIEKMAGAMDVVQRFRTSSTNRRTHSSTSSADSLITDVLSDLLGEKKDIGTAGNEEAVPLTSSPVDMSYTEFFGQSSKYSQPQSSIIMQLPPSFSSPSPGSSATSVASSHPPHAGAGAVASRIREYDRRMSLDQEVPSPTNTRQREERLRKKGASVTVNYGLVQRPSLFIANPDGRTIPSGD